MTKSDVNCTSNNDVTHVHFVIRSVYFSAEIIKYYLAIKVCREGTSKI